MKTPQIDCGLLFENESNIINLNKGNSFPTGPREFSVSCILNTSIDAMIYALKRTALILFGMIMLFAGWSTDVHAQSIFEIQFDESSEKMIGETEKEFVRRVLRSNDHRGRPPSL